MVGRSTGNWKDGDLCMVKHLLRPIITWKVDHVPNALAALGDYIGKQNVGCVFWLPLDGLAINCKKQMNSEKD